MRLGCSRMRKVLHKDFDVRTKDGKDSVVILGETWEPYQCSMHLETTEEKKTGVCNECAKGWTSDYNKPVD